MRIELSSRITLGNADLGEVAFACDLNVIRCLNPVDAQESTIRNQASAVSVLQAVRDFVTL